MVSPSYLFFGAGERIMKCNGAKCLYLAVGERRVNFMYKLEGYGSYNDHKRQEIIRDERFDGTSRGKQG